MTTAAEEALKILMDRGTTDTQFAQAEGQARAQQLEALSIPTARDLAQAAPSSADLRRQQEQQEAFAADQLAAETLINTEAGKLGLNGEQQYLSRISGEFDAVLRKRLTDLQGKARTDEDRRRVALASQILGQDYELFAQLNAQDITARPEDIGGDRVADLSSEDGFGGFVAKAAATAVAGIPGLAAIAAGAVGAEDTAQALGGAASFVQGLAPTDLGSSAAGQQAADIQRRTEAGELSLGEGAAALARLAVTDGDFASDLLGTTVGAAAGGGAVSAGARGVARLAGSTAGAVAAPTTAAGRLVQGAQGTVAPVGVGIGSQVNENITTPQAQVLAGTIGASALVGGVTGLAGGQVAETAIGNLARRVTPGVANPAAATARSSGSVLAPRTIPQQIGSGTARTGVSATGEAAQEFVESGGESLGLSAREGLSNIDAEAIRRAQVSGTLAAPLGAGLGGAVGGVSATGQVRAENRATNAAIEQGIETAQFPARPEGFVTPEQQATLDRQASEGAAEQQVQAEVQLQQDVEARTAELDAEITEAQGVVQEAGPDTPLNQIGQRAPVRATVANSLNPNATVFDDATFANAITRFKNDPVSLRALYRNQANQNPEQISAEGEQTFVEQVSSIPDDATITQARAAVTQAFEQAGSTPAQESLQQSNAAVQAEPSNQAVSSFQEGIANDPANEIATDPTPINATLDAAQQRIAQDSQVASDVDQSEADRTRIAQESAAAAIQTQQLNEAEQAAAVTEVFGDNFQRPETVGATRGELRAVRSPIPTIGNTLGATDSTISDEAFARLFVDSPTSTQNRALEGLIRNSNPSLSAADASVIADQIIDRTEALGDGLTKESALAEINALLDNPAPVLDQAANEPDTPTDPDPSPPAQSLPEAPVLQEESTEVVADQVFDETGQVAAQFEQDLDIMAGPAGPSRNAARDGLPASRARSFRRAASQAKAAKAKLDAGETLTPTEQGHIIRAINLYREGTRLGNLEAPAEGAVAATDSPVEGAVAATDSPAEGVNNTSATTEQSSNNVNTPRASRALAPSSAAPVNLPNAQGLLPEGLNDRLQQFFTQADVQSVVEQITADWKVKPPIVVVDDVSELPADLQDFGQGAAGLSDSGTVYLIANEIDSYPQIGDVLAEEIFHRGILKSLGGNYDPVLDVVFKARGGVEGMLSLVTQYGGRPDFSTAYRDLIVDAQNGDKQAQRALVDETLAQIAVNTKLPSGLRNAIGRIVAKIKNVIRKTFPGMLERYSDNDLLQLVSAANTAGRTAGSGGPTVVRASRKLQADEYYGTDPATGERRIFSAASGQVRPILTARERARQAASNLSDSLNPSPPIPEGASTVINSTSINSLEDLDLPADVLPRWRLNQSKGSGLGPAFFRSDLWQGINKRFANAKIALERVERELEFQPKGTSESLVDAIARQDNLPDMLKEVLARAQTAGQKQALMAINSLSSTYQSRANYLARKDLKLTVDGVEGTVYDFMQRAGESRSAIQDIEGLNDTEAKQQVDIFSTAQHAPERNSTMWARSVELSDTEATAERTRILSKIDSQQVTPADWAKVQQLAQQFATTPETEYVGSGMSNAQAAQIIANIKPELLPLYEQAAKDLRAVQQAANEVKKETGSYSTSLDNVVKLYGWKNYVPLRGRGVELDENLGDAFTAYYSDNEFSTTYRAAEGRESLATGITDSVYRNATQAVIQLAAQDLIESVAVHGQGALTSPEYQQALFQDGENGQLLAATSRDYDLNSAEFKSAMKTKKKEQLVLYDKNNKNNPDNQRAMLVTLVNPRGVDAVMGAKSEAAEGLDNLLRKATVGGKSIHDVTSFTASLKTMRNLPFIPFDALRNMFTLGYESSVQGGLPGMQKYISQYTKPGEKYASDIYRFTQLFADNDFAEIDRRIAQKPGGLMSELDEFYRLGGPVNFLNAIRERTPGDLESISEGPNSGKGIKKATAKQLRALDNMFTKLNMAADTVSRFAFYKSLVEQGVPKEVAAARAKNTANFEKRGTWSGPLGGLFEFFRATAVGSTALINSTLTGEYGKQTAAAAFGAGAGLYLVASMFAGVDDEGDDRMGSINGALFNNNFVFQYGDTPSERLQIGLGFGPIASAISAGIHASRLMLGHASISDTLSNISTGIVNQYKVLPASSISPLDTFNFVASSITPSILKPWAEVSRNLTSLGIPVRSDYAGADSGDLTGSFAGRYGSEQEMYERVTQGLRNSGFANINPDDMRHIMRSYGGTIAYLAESVFENVQAATSEDFAYNNKQGLYLARQFFGSTYSQQPADFYKHYKRVEDLDNQAKKFDAAGNVEAANAIRDSAIYADGIELYKQAKKELEAINEVYKPVFRLDGTTTAEKRAAERDRNEQRSAVFRGYLQDIR